MGGVIKIAKGKGVYKGRKASIDRRVVANMINGGSSVTAVAKSLGISRQSVYRIRDEVGV